MILNVQNLSHSFEKFLALNDINFKIEENSIISILGPSGCGKTSLLRLISGLERIQKGSIHLHDKLVADKKFQTSPEERPVSYVFQDFALFPHMTVIENIRFATKSHKTKTQFLNQIISLTKVDNFLNQYPHSLSGGEQQRVALARSIASQPKLLLLDEPFSDLNASLKKEIIDDTLHLVKSLDSSAIIVTHNANGTAAGYDVRTETVLEDMVDAGIVDPVKVTRIALEKAASVASTMITTECVMTSIKEDNPMPVQPQMPMM